MPVRPYNPPLKELEAAVDQYVAGEEELRAVHKLLSKVAHRELIRRDLGCKLLGIPDPDHARLGAEMLEPFTREIWRLYYVKKTPPENMDLPGELVEIVLASKITDEHRVRMLESVMRARVDVSSAEGFLNAVRQSEESERTMSTATWLLGSILARRGEYEGLLALGLESNRVQLLLGELPNLELSSALVELLEAVKLHSLHFKLLLESGERERACDVVLQGGKQIAQCAKYASEIGDVEVVELVMARRSEAPVAAAQFLSGCVHYPSLRDAVKTDVLRELAREPECRPAVLAALPRLCALRKEALGLPTEVIVNSLAAAAPVDGAALLTALGRAETEVAKTAWPTAVKLLAAKVADVRARAAWFICQYPDLIDDKLQKKIITRAGESDFSVREAAAHTLIALAAAGKSIESAETKLLAAIKKRRAGDDEHKLGSTSASGIALGLIRHARQETNDEKTRTTWMDGLHSSSELLASWAKERIDAEMELDSAFKEALRKTLKPSDEPILRALYERLHAN